MFSTIVAAGLAGSLVLRAAGRRAWARRATGVTPRSRAAS